MQQDGNILAHDSSLHQWIFIMLWPLLPDKFCYSSVDPRSLSAFVLCHLIAVDKKPGIRPIGIGERARQIIGKAILNIIIDNIQEDAWPFSFSWSASRLESCNASHVRDI